MQISTQQFGEKVLFSLSGILDINTVPVFRQAINELLRNGQTKIIINCAALTFIDSAGLEAIIGAQLTARKIKGNISLAEISKALDRIFLITKMNRAFQIFSTNDDALSFEPEKPATIPEN